ncbi:ArsR/SmtB family transcription factor [Halalkalicoccus ordinarius]|uniref:ArsR/SmtB family transcription factor n=1 Tax=Halalkalicoccus ordinarius TaxID=3116651 RepID=UPI00300F0469
MSDTNPLTGCCTSLTPEVDTTVLERDVEVASALANETRYELLRLLVAADGEVCACEFVGSVDASQSTVSRGLSTLYEAGLTTRRKEGQWRYYAPAEAAERLLETFDAIREGR